MKKIALIMVIYVVSLFSLEIEIKDEINFEIADKLKEIDFYITGVDTAGVASFVICNPEMSESRLKQLKDYNDSFNASDITMFFVKKDRQKYLKLCREKISNAIEIEPEYTKRITDWEQIRSYFPKASYSVVWFLDEYLEFERFYIEIENKKEQQYFIIPDFLLKEMLIESDYNKLRYGFNTSANLNIDDKTAYKLVNESERLFNKYIGKDELTDEESKDLVRLQEELLEY